jgi:hypothetical protein
LRIRNLFTLGRFLFTILMIAFGPQHFMYAPFIAFLMPAWIPVRLFFAYFTRTAFIAAGISIAI